VIISDLQHIESATKTEVNGGCRKCWQSGGNILVAPVDPLSDYNPSIEPPCMDSPSHNMVGIEVGKLKLLEPSL
jgi:hypothetical protein